MFQNVDVLTILLPVGLTLFGLIFLYSFFLGKFIERDSDARKKGEAIIASANVKAAEMLAIAAEKSKEIIAKTEILRADFEESLKKDFGESIAKSVGGLESKSHELSGSYDQLFLEVKDEVIKLMHETLKKIEETGNIGLMEFKSSLKEQQQSSVFYIQKRLNQEFENAHLEIKTYKDEQLRKVEESIDRIVLRLSEDIIGRAISLENHERLVLEALNKAKEEGIFAV